MFDGEKFVWILGVFPTIKHAELKARELYFVNANKGFVIERVQWEQKGVYGDCKNCV
jgi:hypothetical protein